MPPEMRFESLLGPASRHRDLVMALLAARNRKPSSKLATLFTDTARGTDLGPERNPDRLALFDLSSSGARGLNINGLTRVNSGKLKAVP